jgi:hypothetical protein
LILKPGRGGGDGDLPATGGTGGPGFGGRSDSGFSMGGKMPQLPIYGPSRQRFARNAGPNAAGNGSRGGGAGAGGPEADAQVGADQLPSQPARDQRGEAIAADAVPEAYREAVKRYFSQEEPNEQNALTRPEHQP